MPTRMNHTPRSVGISTGTWGIPNGIYTSQQSWEFRNEDGRGVHVFINIPNVLSSVTLTVLIQTQDPTSMDWVTLLTSAALSAAGTTLLTVYPGIVAVANTVINQHVGQRVRILVTPSTATAATYSVGAALLV